MRRNTSKYQGIVFGKAHIKSNLNCNDNFKFPFSAKDLEILRFKIDKKMEFENHMDNVCRKVSQQIAILKRMKKIFLFRTRRNLYLLRFYPFAP